MSKFKGTCGIITISIDDQLEVEVQAGKRPLIRHLSTDPLTKNCHEFLGTKQFHGIESLGSIEIEIDFPEKEEKGNWKKEGF